MSSIRLKLSLLLCATLSCVAAHAGTPKVVLLTSIDTPKTWLHRASFNLPAEIEGYFRKAYGKSGYAVEIKHSANAVDLADALQSPDTVGLFWLSHSGGGNDNSPLSLTNVVLDRGGNDVSNVFQKIHPNLRFLALVGCNSKPILKRFASQGFYAHNPNLVIDDYDSVVMPENGFIKSLNHSVDALGDYDRSHTYRDDMRRMHISQSRVDFYEVTNIPRVVARADLLSGQALTDCRKEDGILFEVVRSPRVNALEAMVETQILINGHFLGVLPASRNEQHAAFFVPAPVLNSLLSSGRQLKVKVDSGYAGIPSKKPEFGNFHFKSVLAENQWSLFATAKGEPIGATSVLYRYLGDLSHAKDPVNQITASVFSCRE